MREFIVDEEPTFDSCPLEIEAETREEATKEYAGRMDEGYEDGRLTFYVKDADEVSKMTILKQTRVSYTCVRAVYYEKTPEPKPEG